MTNAALPFNFHDVDYLLDAQLAPTRSEACEAAWSLRTASGKATHRADAAYVGAKLASIFKSNPWLEDITFTLSQEFHLGDDSAGYESYSVEVEAASAVPGSPIPDQFAFEDGVAATDQLRSLFDGVELEFFEVLVDRPNDGGETAGTFTVWRSVIAPALDAETVSGAAVIRLAAPFLAEMLDDAPTPSEERPPIDEETLATWLSTQIEDGHIHLEDVPKLMARYALARPEEVCAEIQERMEQDSARASQQRAPRG